MLMFDRMQTSTHTIMQRIKKLSFVTELMDGSLPIDKFIFYIEQDLFYLGDYARALAIVGARANDNQHCQQFLNFALGGIEAETGLHNDYINRYRQQIPKQDLQISPSCFMYTHYLVRLAALAPVEEAMAALLPCFSIYHEIGTYIANGHTQKNNPYQQWIDLYSGKDFALPTAAAINIVNEVAEMASASIKAKMLTAFSTAAKLEWQFWHSAYCKETWEI